MPNELPKSSVAYLLQALIPYSRPNIKLTFDNKNFFNDLEKISQAKNNTLRNAYYRAQKNGLVEMDDQNIPRLTAKGWQKTRRFTARRLAKDVRLMVIFDIPEGESWKRQRLRRLLRELKFKQIQKSVWATEFDHRELLLAEIHEFDLQNYIEIYETARVYPK